MWVVHLRSGHIDDYRNKLFDCYFIDVLVSDSSFVIRRHRNSSHSAQCKYEFWFPARLN